jgi:hypothetical protein
MSWPTANDYFEAVQHPLRHFHKPDLKRSQVALNDTGKPRVTSGKRQDVYQMRDASGHERWAIGCFTQQPQGQRRRYYLINTHFAAHHSPCLVETDYLDQGISIRGRWFPITCSRWVDGVPLSDWVRNNADQPLQMQCMADAWLRLVRELHQAGLAHGNLCSNTVLVATDTLPGTVKLHLLDYDAMYLPELAATPPEEMGHVDYQHPQRIARQWYHAHADRFSQLLVYTALQALTVGGQRLWQKHDQSGNLLFRERDAREPGTSAVFQELWRSPHGLVRDLAGYLILATQNSVENVPALEQVVDTVRSAYGHANPAATSPHGRSALSEAQVQQIEAVLADHGARSGVHNLELEIEDVVPGAADDSDDSFALTVEDEEPPALQPAPAPPSARKDAELRIFHIEAWMPEQVAVLKLQGFVKDVGGEVVSSVPGLIRVHMLDQEALARPMLPNLLGWLGFVEQPPPEPPIAAVMELQLAHKISDTRKLLGITVSMTPGPQARGAEHWNTYCDRLFCDLRAFLIGSRQ